MAISINWKEKIIFIPRNDLTLVQSIPIEIRELNINWFRMELKALEMSEEGIIFPDTHNHNTEVSLGGLTFARVVELINDYTVTFEDGQYAINLIGANSNVGDRVNVNQVSVRSANSAGLISSPTIEYSSFNNGVIIDINSPYSGTLFPVGTIQKKVNNLSDAILIASYRGFNKLYAYSDLDITGAVNLESFQIVGQSHVNITVNIFPEANVHGISITDCRITGTLDGDTSISGCIIGDIVYVNGHIHASALDGDIHLDGQKDAYIVNCSQLDMEHTPIIDMGGSGQNLVMPNYSGLVKIVNMNGPDVQIGIGLNGGSITLDSNTVTDGFIEVSGVGELLDENMNAIKSGVWNGVAIVNTLMSKDSISTAVWDELLASHIMTGTTGRALTLIEFDGYVRVNFEHGQSGTTFPLGTPGHPVNNFTDAIDIAIDHKIRKFYISGIVTPTIDFDNYAFEGSTDSFVMSQIISSTSFSHSTFKDLSLTGQISCSLVQFINCYIENISGISGEMIGGRLSGNIQPSGYLSGIEVVVEGDNTTIDVGTSVFSFDIDSGYLLFINAVEGSLIEINLRGGEIELDSSCVGGEFYIEGYGTLTNNSSMIIKGNNLQDPLKNNIPGIYDTGTAGYVIDKIQKTINDNQALILIK